MRASLTLRLSPEQSSDLHSIRQSILSAKGIRDQDLSGYHIDKKSIDARGKKVLIQLSITAFIGEPAIPKPRTDFSFQDVTHAPKQVIIIGAGPAGLFAALKCLEEGIRPIILERGKDVRARRRDLAALSREGILNTDSNYCFGEGGAGTYSDGKLYTRSSKRGDIERILQLFVHFGADPAILYESHPHIGTNRLPRIITAMREQIISCGGKIHFGQRVVTCETRQGKIHQVYTHLGDRFEGDAYILATGHSARDVFHMLADAGIRMDAKPLAIGVRVEHPQFLIDALQYHCMPSQPRSPYLPPASYQLVSQENGRGVFSFCMCPGGIIAPASTSPGELVVNGWSPSARNNRFANSGMVVQADIKDAIAYFTKSKKNIPPDSPLIMMYLQAEIEASAYSAGGGGYTAPAQRMTDFIEGKTSVSLPECSYPRGIQPADLRSVLPAFISHTLRDGFRTFGKKMRGYLTADAVVVATESRTSSPVRIPRDSASLQHPQICNLYPCGEGAGYAGGIVSAAMDGEKVAHTISQQIQKN